MCGSCVAMGVTGVAYVNLKDKTVEKMSLVKPGHR